MIKQQTLTEILTACAGAIYSSDEGTHSYVLGDDVRLPCPGLSYCACDKASYCKCFGCGWVPNPDPYAWRRAIRTLGGALVIDSSGSAVGDEVKVYIGNILRRVEMREGFRDQLAEATAIERALKQIPGVEMGE